MRQLLFCRAGVTNLQTNGTHSTTTRQHARGLAASASQAARKVMVTDIKNAEKDY